MTDLPQTLKPNQRGVALYQDGELLGYEVVATLTAEQLQALADEARLVEIAAMGQSTIKVPVLAEGFKLLCKRLGFD